MEMGDRFMLYTDYYTNYPAAVQLINVRACVFVCLLVCVCACVCASVRAGSCVCASVRAGSCVCQKQHGPWQTHLSTHTHTLSLFPSAGEARVTGVQRKAACLPSIDWPPATPHRLPAQTRAAASQIPALPQGATHTDSHRHTHRHTHTHNGGTDAHARAPDD